MSLPPLENMGEGGGVCLDSRSSQSRVQTTVQVHASPESHTYGLSSFHSKIRHSASTEGGDKVHGGKRSDRDRKIPRSGFLLPSVSSTKEAGGMETCDKPGSFERFSPYHKIQDGDYGFSNKEY